MISFTEDKYFSVLTTFILKLSLPGNQIPRCRQRHIYSAPRGICQMRTPALRNQRSRCLNDKGLRLSYGPLRTSHYHNPNITKNFNSILAHLQPPPSSFFAFFCILCKIKIYYFWVGISRSIAFCKIFLSMYRFFLCIRTKTRRKHWRLRRVFPSIHLSASASGYVCSCLNPAWNPRSAAQQHPAEPHAPP